MSRDAYDERYGKPDPTRFDTPALPANAELSYHAQIQPILSRRCVVCHGCYDASCQLKLGAWEGVARGSSKQPVYDAERLREAPPTRLFVDAQQPSQWRGKGFDAVLNERRDTPEANLAGSVLYQSLALKQQHPLPAGPVLGEDFDFSIDRDNACPRIDQFADHAAEHPLAGMPYGLPGLNADEQAKLTRWLAAGSPYEGDVPPSTGAKRAGAPVGGLSERAVDEGAADEPLPVRAPVPRPPALRCRPRAPGLSHRALDHTERPAGADHRHAPALRRSRAPRTSTTGSNPSAR